MTNRHQLPIGGGVVPSLRLFLAIELDDDHSSPGAVAFELADIPAAHDVAAAKRPESRFDLGTVRSHAFAVGL